MLPRMVSSFFFCVLLQTLPASALHLEKHTNRGNSKAKMSFENFVKMYGRTYEPDTVEYEERSAIFAKHLEEIAHHNGQSHHIWVKGNNHLLDWTDKELAMLRGYRHHAQSDAAAGSRPLSFLQHGLTKNVELPAEKSWQHLNSSKVVYDQGSCGSCWALAVSTVMHAHSIIHATERTFSVQEMLDCTPNPDKCGGSGGCQGATAELGFDYLNRHGLATSDQVPYMEKDNKCQNVGQSFKSAADMANHRGMDLQAEGVRLGDAHGQGGASFGMIGWERLPENKYEPLMRALAEKGPVAVSVAAADWSFYQSGVFNGCGKDATIDHAVTMIGYGQANDMKYWHIQNSWGELWGEKGSIRLIRSEKDETDHCGTDKAPQEGTGCQGGPTTVTVCGQCGVLYDSVVPIFKTHDVVAPRIPAARTPAAAGKIPTV